MDLSEGKGRKLMETMRCGDGGKCGREWREDRMACECGKKDKEMREIVTLPPS